MQGTNAIMCALMSSKHLDVTLPASRQRPGRWAQTLCTAASAA